MNVALVLNVAKVSPLTKFFLDLKIIGHVNKVYKLKFGRELNTAEQTESRDEVL